MNISEYDEETGRLMQTSMFQGWVCIVNFVSQSAGTGLSDLDGNSGDAALFSPIMMIVFQMISLGC